MDWVVECLFDLDGVFGNDEGLVVLLVYYFE